jgi:hypothetical protein
MNDNDRLLPEDEQACARLAPYVRRACAGTPSPAVLETLRAATAHEVRQGRVLPFVRFLTAAAALLIVSLTGWFLIRSSLAARADRQVALMDDVLFLCADEPASPEAAAEGKREELARRLLTLQGLDEVAEPAAPEAPAEPASPPSRDPQSHNTPEPRAQRCG